MRGKVLRRILIYAFGVGFVLLGLAYLFVPPITLEITENELQDQISAALPKTVTKAGTTIVVDQARMSLAENNKIGIQAAFRAKGYTLEGIGTADVSSRLRYHFGKFYLTDLSHEQVSFTFSQNSRDTISDVRDTLKNILQRETEVVTAMKTGRQKRVAAPS